MHDQTPRREIKEDIQDKGEPRKPFTSFSRIRSEENDSLKTDIERRGQIIGSSLLTILNRSLNYLNSEVTASISALREETSARFEESVQNTRVEKDNNQENLKSDRMATLKDMTLEEIITVMEKHGWIRDDDLDEDEIRANMAEMIITFNLNRIHKLPETHLNDVLMKVQVKGWLFKLRQENVPEKVIQELIENGISNITMFKQLNEEIINEIYIKPIEKQHLMNILDSWVKTKPGRKPMNIQTTTKLIDDNDEESDDATQMGQTNPKQIIISPPASSFHSPPRIQLNALSMPAVQSIIKKDLRLKSWDEKTCFSEFFSDTTYRIDLENLADEESMKELRKTLTGEARRKSEDIIKNDPLINYKKYKQELISRMVSSAEISACSRKLKDKKFNYGDDVEAHHKEIIKLVRTIYGETDELMVKRALMYSLPNDLHDEILFAKRHNTVDMILEGMITKGLKEHKKQETETPQDNTDKSDNLDKQIEKKIKELNLYEQNKQTYQSRWSKKAPPTLAERPLKTKTFQRRCYICNSIDHIRANCPKLKLIEDSGGEEKQQNAAKKSSNVVTKIEDNETFYSFVATIKSNLSEPTIGLQLKTRHKPDFIIEKEALVDTGSNVTIISSELCKQLDWEPNLTKTTFKGVGNNICKPKGIVNIYWHLSHTRAAGMRPTKQKIYVLENTNHDLLLGKDFIKSAKLTIKGDDNGFSVINEGYLNEGPMRGCFYGFKLDEEEELDEVFNSLEVKPKEVQTTDEVKNVLKIAIDNVIVPRPKLYDVYKILESKLSNNLSKEEKIRMMNLFKRYDEVWSKHYFDLGHVDPKNCPVDIKMTGPIKYQAPYRYSEAREKILTQELAARVKYGLLTPTNAPGGIPCILLDKKGEGHRLVYDLRNINKVIEKVKFPIPNIDDILQALKHKNYYAKGDLLKAFPSIRLTEENAKKIILTTHIGKFKCNVLPEGLCLSSEVFQSFINQHFGDLIDKNNLKIFIDDVIWSGETFDDLLNSIEETLKRMRDLKVKLSPNKMEFGSDEVTFLGHRINKDGIKPDLDKVEAIRRMKTPKNIKELRSQLGLYNYLSRYIPQYSKTVACLYELTKKNVVFKITEEHETALKKIKEALIKDCLLVHFDPQKPHRLMVDASAFAVGGMLMQSELDNWRCISYFSQKLETYQRNYTTTEKECYAVVVACVKFRHYLEGEQFEIISDHCALCNIKKLKFNNPRVCRWAMLLSAFDYEIKYSKGKDHPPDCLSRITDWSHRLPKITEDEVNDRICNELVKNVQFVEHSSMFNEKSFKKAQKDDEFCSSIMKSIIDANSNIMKHFEMINSILYKRPSKKHKQPRLVIPKSLQDELFNKLHVELTGGHFGILKTMNKIIPKYYYQKQSEDIKNRVKSCIICQKMKHHVKQIKIADEIPIPKLPMRNMQLDAMGPFIDSTSGNRNVLVLIDVFSRFVYAQATKDITTKTVIKFLERVFIENSYIKVLQTDRGTNFMSKSFEKYLENAGIKHVLSSVSHPEAQGLVERQNGTLGQLIRCYASDNPYNWDQSLQDLVRTYNTQKHGTIKVTPHLAHKGYNYVSQLENSSNKLNNGEEWLNEILDVTAIREAAHKYAKISSKAYVAKHPIKTFDLKPGDLVKAKVDFVDLEKGKKLTERFKGPYIIIKKFKESVFKIYDPLTGKSTVKNICKLAKFNGPNPANYHEILKKFNIEHIEDVSKESSNDEDLLPSINEDERTQITELDQSDNATNQD